MKTEYKYIHIVKIADKPKTSVWSCRNNRSEGELGVGDENAPAVLPDGGLYLAVSADY